MSMYLKLKCQKTFDGKVLFRITEQRDITRGEGLVYMASNGVNIISTTIPDWTPMKLYVRGTLDHRDARMFHVPRQDFAKIKQAVEDLNSMAAQRGQPEDFGIFFVE